MHLSISLGANVCMEKLQMIMFYMYIVYHDASKVVKSIPRCNMALKRSVSGNGTLAVK